MADNRRIRSRLLPDPHITFSSFVVHHIMNGWTLFASSYAGSHASVAGTQVENRQKAIFAGKEHIADTNSAISPKVLRMKSWPMPVIASCFASSMSMTESDQMTADLLQFVRELYSSEAGTRAGG